MSWDHNTRTFAFQALCDRSKYAALKCRGRGRSVLPPFPLLGPRLFFCFPAKSIKIGDASLATATLAARPAVRLQSHFATNDATGRRAKIRNQRTSQGEGHCIISQEGRDLGCGWSEMQKDRDWFWPRSAASSTGVLSVH